jgi:hypothetical protein
MENNQEIWTEAMVASAFEEAMRILRKLPAEKLRDYFCNWPQVIYSEIELLRMDQKPRRWAVSTQNISKLEMICSWIHFVEDIEARKIIWLRARKTPWQLICGEFGISRATANRKWKNAIRTITQKLE